MCKQVASLILYMHAVITLKRMYLLRSTVFLVPIMRIVEHLDSGMLLYLTLPLALAVVNNIDKTNI